MKNLLVIILFGVQLASAPLAAFHYGSDPVKDETEALEEEVAQ